MWKCRKCNGKIKSRVRLVIDDVVYLSKKMDAAINTAEYEKLNKNNYEVIRVWKNKCESCDTVGALELIAKWEE